MRNIPPGPWGSFVAKADTFMVKTEEHALQGVNPGGYYHATWCRDASYILRDWTLSGNMTGSITATVSNMVSSDTARERETCLW